MLGILYSVLLGERIRYPDEADYSAIAENIIQGHGYSLDGNTPTAYRPPGFTWLMTAGMAAGGLLSARILNMVCFTGCLGCVFVLARRVAGPTAGIAAIICGLLYPVLFYTAGTFYPQTLGALLLLLCMVIVFGKPLTAWRAIAVGIPGGLLMLTVPSMVFFWGCLLVTAVIINDRNKFRNVILAGVVSVLLTSVWFVRNYNQFESCFFVSTNSGINLLLGNSENTTPNSGVNVDLSAYRKANLNEVEKDRYYRASAVRYMRTHPLHTVKLYGLKFINYFNYRNKLKVASEGSPLRNLMMLVSYGALLLLTILRIIMRKRYPLSAFEIFAVSVYVLNGLFAAVFFTRIRFRLPFDWLLICIAGIALSYVAQSMLDKSGETPNSGS